MKERLEKIREDLKKIYCFEPEEYQLLLHDGGWWFNMDGQETKLEKIDETWMLEEA